MQYKYDFTHFELNDPLNNYTALQWLQLAGAVRLCMKFACSPHVCMGFLRVLRLPPKVQRCAKKLG